LFGSVVVGWAYPFDFARGKLFPSSLRKGGELDIVAIPAQEETALLRLKRTLE